MEQNSNKTSKMDVNNNIETSSCFATMAELLRPKKKAKTRDLSTVTLGYIKNKNPLKDNEDQRLRILFDSGCGATLINKRFVRHWKKVENKATKWTTKAGSFKSKSKCKIKFTLPAFHENRVISCNAYVDESHHASCSYDMIIGRDLCTMLELGLKITSD